MGTSRLFFSAETANHLQATLLDRVELGLILRETAELWPICIDVACIHLLLYFHEKLERDFPIFSSTIIYVSNFLIWTILNMQLDECWKQRPYLDGGKLIKELGIPKGPLVGKVMLEQIKFMLRCPPSETKEQEEARIQGCLEHLKIYLETVK